MMDPSDYTFDLARMLFGEYSLLIYLEILIRVIIIMSYTMLIIKWIGKRSVGEIGSSDVLIIVAMGSSVGDAMFYPTIPLSVAILVITAIGSLQKLYVYLSIKYEVFRRKMHPDVVKLVEEGKLLKDNLEKDDIDKNEVLMLLREKGIRYLSEVEAAYFEASGKLSLYRYDNPEKKNSILPKDVENAKDDDFF